MASSDVPPGDQAGNLQSDFCFCFYAVRQVWLTGHMYLLLDGSDPATVNHALVDFHIAKRFMWGCPKVGPKIELILESVGHFPAFFKKLVAIWSFKKKTCHLE